MDEDVKLATPRQRRRKKFLFQALMTSGLLWSLVVLLWGMPSSPRQIIGLIVGIGVNLLVIAMIFKRVKHRDYESAPEPTIDPITMSMYDGF